METLLSIIRLQTDAAQVLANVCSGPADVAIEAGAVPVLVELLLSQHGPLVGQALWCLSNITGDAGGHRMACISHGVISNLLR